uniref:ABI family, member 3 (NESH) binding protein a n=1 Tax=Tetraodon nigroviridis TaxID=99883 RepID=H3CB19_TETNG
KFRITATGDTIVLKYLLPNAHTKLEGYILGYGSRMFSKQFIQLPENGLPFVKEFDLDAEAKYLITVKPIQINEVKKYCKGKVELEKPLNLVVGPVTPSSVLLSWGDTLKNPYTGNILKECLEEGHYTVRYREKDKKWSYQTCPTSDTVIDNLKPNAVYEFGVKPISKEGSGEWSNPVVHNTMLCSEDRCNPSINCSFLLVHSLLINKKNITFIFLHHIVTSCCIFCFLHNPGGEDFSRSILPLNIKPTMASLPVSHAYMAKCEEHHHKQPQEIPKSKQHSQHLPKQKQHPKHTPLNDSHKQFPSTPLPQKHYPKKLLPDTDLYPKFNLAHFTTPQTKPQTKPQPTLQPQSQMSVQPVNQPSDPKLVTNSHLRFQPTRKPLQSHNLAPEQPHLQPAPNLILQTSPQTLQPNSPAHSQPELISQTAPSNNVQPIHPKFQAQPRMPKPPSLSTSKPITQTQSEDQQRSKPKHHNKLQPEPQPWTQQQFHESKAQPQPVTDSIFQTQKQTIFLPTTETQKQHWPTAKEETQTHLNKILLPQTEDKKQPQTTNKLTTQTKQPPQLTLSPMASNEHQVQWQPTLEPLVQIKPVSQPVEADKISCRPYFPPIDLSNLSVSLGAGVQSGLKDEAPNSPVSSSAPPTQRNAPLFYPQVPQRPSRPISTSPVKSEEKPNKPRDPKPKDNKASVMKRPAVTPRPRQERRQGTTTAAPAVNCTSDNCSAWSENSTIFSSLPTSDVDATGKKRYIAPHVIYKTDKRPEEPCSITSSLSYFPDEEANDLNVTSPPRIPPSNLTVVTVEGCPSFVILDWQKSDNETTEYEIHSTTKGERGVEKSVVTTNQTHTAVENLKPESNYEFTVTPKNELGAGPPTDPVSFSTESADPRVSEYVSDELCTGKNSIWSDFPFQSTDAAYSECHGRMFVKRTWYRKFVGIQLCNSLRYQIYLSDSLNGKFYNIGDLTGQGEDHCQFVDSFLDGNTGSQVPVNELPKRPGFYRAMRHEPVTFGEVGGNSRATYVGWYECGTPIPGKW